MPLGAKAAIEPAHERTRWVFLLAFTLPLWLFYFLMNFWKNTEVNWPAASYFSGMVLLAGAFVRWWNAPDAKLRRRWRIWGTVIILWGFALSMLALNLDKFYPLAARHLAELKGKPKYTQSLWFPGKWDIASRKLRGFTERGEIVGKALDQLRHETGLEPLIVTPRYDTSSSLAFYVPGQPFVYCIMSSVGGRQSQYDLWPGINEKIPPETSNSPAVPCSSSASTTPKSSSPSFAPPSTASAIWCKRPSGIMASCSATSR